MENIINMLVFDAGWYALLFVVFTALAFVSRGRDAFNWSPKIRQSAVTNLLFLYVGGLNGILYLLTIAPLAASYHWIGLPALSAEFWEGTPLLLKGLIALFVYDLSMYWIHRILHTSWLWPSHAVHHSDPEMHYLTWSRGHFTEQLFFNSVLVFTSSWLGFDFKEILVIAIFQGVHQHYVHAKLDWDHGIFKYVLVSPQMHRWHHANVPAAYDKNFASIFPVFDMIWGTYYNPGSAIDTPTGISDEPANDFMTQLMYPFRRWAEMLAARKKAKPATPEAAATP